jgi:choline-sulfatase
MRIIYLDIDSCRPDHLGCYGYHRNTSPHIDAVAREGMLFRQCYTSDAPCMPSRSALYSGRFGIQTGVVGHGGTAAQPKVQGAARGFRDVFVAQGLAYQLQERGFHATMISPFGQRHAAHWIYAGFNEIHNTGQDGLESATDVTAQVSQWLAAQAQSPRDAFLHVNYWDPHTPYRVPTDYGNPFAEDTAADWITDEVLTHHRQLTGPHTARDLGMYHGDEDPAYPRQPGELNNLADVRRLVDGYDVGIRYVDDQIGRIVADLKAAGLYDDTAIIISGDHGENLGELGIYAEHSTADDATCRVPLIIKWPRGVTGENSRFHYNVDLAPTLMELLDGSCQPLWDGQSFASAITCADADAGRDEVIISQCAHVCQRSVRWNRWLYVRTYHDGFHLFPSEMLFDLETDPHEQNDLAPTQTGVCQEGAWRLARWHDAQMQKISQTASDVVDPLWTVMREGGPFHARTTKPGQPGGPEGLRRYLTRLESTNRASGAAQLRQRYADLLGP